MRDYDAEAEHVHDEYLAGAMDTGDFEDYMRQLDEDREQEAREMYGDDNDE